MVIEYFPVMHKALGDIQSTQRNRNGKDIVQSQCIFTDKQNSFTPNFLNMLSIVIFLLRKLLASCLNPFLSTLRSISWSHPSLTT